MTLAAIPRSEATPLSFRGAKATRNLPSALPIGKPQGREVPCVAAHNVVPSHQAGPAGPAAGHLERALRPDGGPWLIESVPPRALEAFVRRHPQALALVRKSREEPGAPVVPGGDPVGRQTRRARDWASTGLCRPAGAAAGMVSSTTEAAACPRGNAGAMGGSYEQCGEHLHLGREKRSPVMVVSKPGRSHGPQPRRDL